MASVRRASGMAVCVAAALSPTAVTVADGAAKVTGSVFYRTGSHHSLRPDRKARVMLFRGEQSLALKAAAKLRDFEKRYPEGLERREDRPIEEATRSAAMVLLT